MARSIKAKAGKGAAAAPKRRKKSALANGGSSPALSAASSSSASTPHAKECEQCGNPLLLDGVARAWPSGKKSAASTGCQICDFVAFRRSQRPCVQCARSGCDYFCEWCGRGFHARCARLRDEDVGNANGFCCRRCEEQSDDEEKNEEDVGSRCGSCREPFSCNAKDEDGKLPTGFKVNQAVLVDNEEVLYNALITDVDAKGERIKIHFTRWSKSFDDWYNMDDEHINESLACDCCNQWFHIGCLPPIKSSGRWKDSTYVCPRCIDDARAFHNGNRSVLKEKAAYISTSKAISASAKAAKKATSPKESENATVAVAKSKKPSKAPVVLDDDDEDMEEKDEEHEAKEEDNEKKAPRTQSRRKRKLSEVVESSGDAETEENEQPESSEASAMDKTVVASSASTDGGATAKPSAEASAKEPTTAKEDVADKASSGTDSTANNAPKALADANESDEEATMHASPEHTVRSIAEAHSSPSKAAASKIGAAKSQPNDSEVDEQAKTVSESTNADAAKRRNVSSCNSVMSILNSPPTTENPTKGFKPTVTSLPMLNPSLNNRGSTTTTSASIPNTSKGIQSNLPVYVKMEQKNGQFPLYPKAIAKLASHPVQPATSTKNETTAGPQKATKAVPRGTKRGQPGAAPGSRGSSLSAFDILREVASQSIGDDAEDNTGTTKPKREKRVSTSRTNNSNKRVKTDASTSTSNTTASPGRTAPSGSHVADASQQSRDRIQMNSFVDLHFSIRKEMYLRFCRLEEEGMLTRDSAHVLRSLIYPTSDRFQDLKFVYLVNKDLPSVQLTKRLLEAVPYPPVAKPLATPIPHANGALRSPLGSKTLGLPVSMGMFSAGLNRASPSAGATHMNLLPPPPGSTLLRPEPPRTDQSSRVASASANAPQRANVSAGASTATASAPAKRPEMLTTIMEQLAPTHRPLSNQQQPPQQQQQQQRLLNSR